MKELKACPFCGKQVAEITNCIELEDCANFEACDNCGFVCVVCSANNGGCGATGGYAPTEKQAVEKWNRRATPEKPHAEWVADEYEYNHCSECGYEHDSPEYITRYCPGCGACMEDEDDTI